jgi:hypothetical protein
MKRCIWILLVLAGCHAEITCGGDVAAIEKAKYGATSLKAEKEEEGEDKR